MEDYDPTTSFYTSGADYEDSNPSFDINEMGFTLRGESPNPSNLLQPSPSLSQSTFIPTQEDDIEDNEERKELHRHDSFDISSSGCNNKNKNRFRFPKMIMREEMERRRESEDPSTKVRLLM